MSTTSKQPKRAAQDTMSKRKQKLQRKVIIRGLFKVRIARLSERCKRLTLHEVHDSKCWPNAKHNLKSIQINASLVEGYNRQNL